MKTTLCLVIAGLIFLSGVQNFAKESSNRQNRIKKVHFLNQKPIKDYWSNNIIKNTADNKRYISTDFGRTWTEISSPKNSPFRVSSYNGDVEVKNDFFSVDNSYIKIFNIYGELLTCKKIDDKDVKFFVGGGNIQLIIYTIERDNITIQKGKLVLND